MELGEARSWSTGWSAGILKIEWKEHIWNISCLWKVSLHEIHQRFATTCIILQDLQTKASTDSGYRKHEPRVHAVREFQKVSVKKLFHNCSQRLLSCHALWEHPMLHGHSTRISEDLMRWNRSGITSILLLLVSVSLVVGSCTETLLATCWLSAKLPAKAQAWRAAKTAQLSRTTDQTGLL